ncbi:MAG: ribonuclease H-like domain-containing protein, partial [Nitrospiraceae bacterium]
MENCSYLDIETTGLSPLNGELTVIGVHLEDAGQNGFIQLVGDEITPSRLKDIMGNTQVIYTYNGSRFDLPFIREKLGVDLSECCQHR